MDLHVKNFISKKLIRRVVYGIIGLSILGGVSYGGAAYYLNNQHQQSIQARTDMIRAQAEQNNLTLLSEDQIKDITAKNTGVAVSDLQFKSIQLKPYSEEVHKKDKHDKKYKHENKKDRHQNQQQAASGNPANAAAAANNQAADGNNPQGAPTQGDANPQAQNNNAGGMQAPIYKVKAIGPNRVEYELKINSVTGEVIAADVDD